MGRVTHHFGLTDEAVPLTSLQQAAVILALVLNEVGAHVAAMAFPCLYLTSSWT